jgi:hypothetical protein
MGRGDHGPLYCQNTDPAAVGVQGSGFRNLESGVRGKPSRRSLLSIDS